MNLTGMQGDPTGATRAQVEAAVDAARLARVKRSADAGPPPPENREKAAEELEKLFVSLLVKEMRQTLPEGFFAKGPGSDVYSGFFDQMMSEALTAGRGTGLKDQILAGWNTTGPSATPPESEKALSEKTTP